MSKKQKKVLIRILVSLVLTIGLNLLELPPLLKLAAFFAVYLVIGYDILRKAFFGIINGRLMDENFLMAIATAGAFVLAVYSGSGDYNEAVAVMLFYQTGELFQSCAVGKSRRNIAELMNIRPDYANVEDGGILTRVSARDIEPGTVITVQPGERIAIDGIVCEGTSMLDTSALTGESLPRGVAAGDMAYSGCINLDSVIKIRTAKRFSESTVSRILELVENATSRKSRSERFISRFARIYTPAVCISALCLAAVPSAIMQFSFGINVWAQWIYRALTFLVISCPCALVISIPLSFFAGIGGLSRDGILVKGSNYLEALSGISCIAFDKTGTLTEGVFKVNKVICQAFEEAKLIELAAYAECAVSHPIGRSICARYGKEFDRTRVSDIREYRGMGVCARVDGGMAAVGNSALMESFGISHPPYAEEGTVVYVAYENSYIGTIVISDRIKESSTDTINALKRAGIKTVMLTGDNRHTACKTAEVLGIDEVLYELLPQDKVAAIENLMEQNNGKTAFAGDGINDAPVLARADVGIAMGTMGSDAAIEAADVVIMDDDISRIHKAIRCSAKCMRIVRENIAFSLSVKFICLGLVACGFADMWLGIFADVGVMVLAVVNSVRAFKF